MNWIDPDWLEAATSAWEDTQAPSVAVGSVAKMDARNNTGAGGRHRAGCVADGTLESTDREISASAARRNFAEMAARRTSRIIEICDDCLLCVSTDDRVLALNSRDRR